MTLSEHILCSYLISFLLTSVDLNRRRQWHPTPVLLPGKSHGRRSLVGYSPRDSQESSPTPQFKSINFLALSFFIGEDNGTPVQYSFLENPMDGGAWWAAVHGVTTSLSLSTFVHWRRKWQPTPVFLPGESQGQGSLVGCRLRGLTESDTTEAT